MKLGKLVSVGEVVEDPAVEDTAVTEPATVEPAAESVDEAPVPTAAGSALDR